MLTTEIEELEKDEIEQSMEERGCNKDEKDEAEGKLIGSAKESVFVLNS